MEEKKRIIICEAFSGLILGAACSRLLTPEGGGSLRKLQFKRLSAKLCCTNISQKFSFEKIKFGMIYIGRKNVRKRKRSIMQNEFN